jgi:ubiquinol-cytochrome c reductase cytochrome c1 subunit
VKSKNTVRRFACLLASLCLALPAAGFASSGEVRLDKAPIDGNDKLSLQRGARNFVNYCLSCHGASYMRYNRLQDLGLTEKQIKDNLLFTTDKVGDTMTVALTKQDGVEWLGVSPPDLSVITRSRGVDWVYSFLRSFYRDSTHPTGWNNLVFDSTAMPHVLWQLNGEPKLLVQAFPDHEQALAAYIQIPGVARLKTEIAHTDGKETESFAVESIEPGKPGTLNPQDYDAFVADLVNYLAYMAEPAKALRHRVGIVVLIFLGLFFVIAYRLKKEYWKDVH